MKISKYIKNNSYDIKTVDFTMLGFRKISTWIKGRKVKTDYCDEITGDIVVQKLFNDIIENDVLVGVEIVFNWIGEDDEIEDTKTQKAYLDILEAGEMTRKRRQRAIDKLVLSTRAFPQIAYVLDTIFSHYKVEIEKFIATGSDVFRDAMENEENEEIKGLLNAIANPENNFTVKDSILYEI